MPKRLIQRYLPDSREVRRHPWIRRFGHRLHDPNLWHLNRRSFAGGVAIGLFCALLPLPGQMVAAAALAILFRANLPTAVVLVWLTNPLTIPPVFFAAYLFGCYLLGKPPVVADLANWKALLAHFEAIWVPLLTGSLVLGTLLAGVGYVIVRFLWRWYVLRKQARRNARRTAPASRQAYAPVVRMREPKRPEQDPGPHSAPERKRAVPTVRL
ncbi:MAG: DUF2062 domain-containing protein [Gammaproteobacteria bacterium]|nr:MAG: DUF2062 domain-containing protein [Gammaproteobacteria bacterium]